MPTESQQVFEIKITRAEAWAILGATPEEHREEPLNWVQQRIAQMIYESLPSS